MAELVIHASKIKRNILKLSDFFKKHDVQWSLVTKVFSGDKEFLRHIITDEVIESISSVGDSRLTSLKNLRQVKPHIKTIYIKPPAKIYAEEVVRYADISLNSSYATIKALNDQAKKQGKRHQIIIMMELGELREGVSKESIISLYEKVMTLSHIQVIGIGSNLGCMYGVEPTYEKLEQLVQNRRDVISHFHKPIELISGGSSITLPLLHNDTIPKEINHFRIGEAAFFGVSPLRNEQFLDLETSTFEFYANIIELEYKSVTPDGTISDAGIGLTKAFHPEQSGKLSYKAILDFGILDVDKKDIEFTEDGMSFVGVTSDMLVIDVGKNKTADNQRRFSVGDRIKFTPNYMAVARLLNSKFIDKVYV